MFLFVIFERMKKKGLMVEEGVVSLCARE